MRAFGWSAIVVALLAAVVSTSVAATALAPGGTFIDDDGSAHEPSIEAIAAAGITVGCNAPAGDRYCPGRNVTRAEMATFLTRALHLTGTVPDRFTDDNATTHEPAINQIAAVGITIGCNEPAGDRYCPDRNVTRAEMATFLTRALNLTGTVPDRFTDDNGTTHEHAINQVAAAGITVGCNQPAGDRYCPDRNVTRAEMATFLTRALHLTPLVPPVRCSIFPADNIWNARVDSLPVAARSADYVNTIGASATLLPDFGSGEWPPGSGSPIGIPVAEAPPGQPLATITWTAYGNESDPGPYPIPDGAVVEGGAGSDGDRHVLAVDKTRCVLAELYRAFPTGPMAWNADSGAVYDLTSNDLRPDGWTSADAAGLPIYPGLARFDEVAAGRITHALRFTAPVTSRSHVWPARHDAGSTSSPAAPPMGQRFRLRAGGDISGFSAPARVILTGLREYGMMLADNGSAWVISGAPDARWDNDVLRELRTVPGSWFEAVDVNGLMVTADSGQVG